MGSHSKSKMDSAAYRFPTIWTANCDTLDAATKVAAEVMQQVMLSTVAVVERAAIRVSTATAAMAAVAMTVTAAAVAMTAAMAAAATTAVATAAATLADGGVMRHGAVDSSAVDGSASAAGGSAQRMLVW